MSNVPLHFISNVLLHFISNVPLHFISNVLLHFISNVPLHFISNVPLHFISNVPLHFISNVPLHFISNVRLHFISNVPLHFISNVLLHFISNVLLHFISNVLLHFISNVLLHFSSSYVFLICLLTQSPHTKYGLPLFPNGIPISSLGSYILLLSTLLTPDVSGNSCFLRKTVKTKQRSNYTSEQNCTVTSRLEYCIQHWRSHKKKDTDQLQTYNEIQLKLSQYRESTITLNNTRY